MQPTKETVSFFLRGCREEVVRGGDVAEKDAGQTDAIAEKLVIFVRTKQPFGKS